LDDIIEAAEHIENYTSGLSLKAFSKDRKTRDAVLYNLQVVGEAIKKVPEEIRSRHPDVEWKKIAGLRDILVHEYFGIDVDIVWDVVVNKLPDLKLQIEKILAD
jgi:uncharacterized protein with HEPN domain